MKTSRYFFTALLVILTLAAVTTTVSASPPSGQTPSNLVIGRLSDPINVNVDNIKFRSNDSTDIAMFTVTYSAGGYSGWHTHPGILFVVVVSGSVVRTVKCQEPRTYVAGQSFVESDAQPAGEVQNASTTASAVLQVTQIVPQGSVRRVEAVQPAC
jgi:quercetin dioxygenase-like cupin family protein